MDGIPSNLTPDQSYLIGEILKNKVQADYDHRTFNLVAGVRTKIFGQWNYIALLDVVDGAGLVPAVDVVELSWNASTFRTFPRGLFIKIPTPVNGWLEIVSSINCTVKLVVGIGEIRDARQIPPSGGVPVTPVAGACFPIELCGGLTSLPVSVVNPAAPDCGPKISLTPGGGWGHIESSFGPGFNTLIAPDPVNYTVIEGLDVSLLGAAIGLAYSGVIRLGTRAPAFVRDIRLFSSNFFALSQIQMNLSPSRRWILDPGWDVYAEIAGSGTGLIPTGSMCFRYRRFAPSELAKYGYIV